VMHMHPSATCTHDGRTQLHSHHHASPLPTQALCCYTWCNDSALLPGHLLRKDMAVSTIPKPGASTTQPSMRGLQPHISAAIAAATHTGAQQILLQPCCTAVSTHWLALVDNNTTLELQQQKLNATCWAAARALSLSGPSHTPHNKPHPQASTYTICLQCWLTQLSHLSIAVSPQCGNCCCAQGPTPVSISL
jgi:hypothetical protein